MFSLAVSILQTRLIFYKTNADTSIKGLRPLVYLPKAKKINMCHSNSYMTNLWKQYKYQIF
jgi:hypothetical protein